MTNLKDWEGANFQCLSCIKNDVCSIKSCLEETRFETTHPAVIIKVECTKYAPTQHTFIKGGNGNERCIQ